MAPEKLCSVWCDTVRVQITMKRPVSTRLAACTKITQATHVHVLQIAHPFGLAITLCKHAVEKKFFLNATKDFLKNKFCLFWCLIVPVPNHPTHNSHGPLGTVVLTKFGFSLVNQNVRGNTGRGCDLIVPY